MDITQRQKSILIAIIQEFLKTATAVGSLSLSDKYDLGVSPATLRAEMSRLVEKGYLDKPHLSSGRVPTTKGFRYFVDEVLEERELNQIRQTELKERLFQNRFNKYKFLKEAVKTLADLSDLAALSYVDDMIYFSGIRHLLTNPEFCDLRVLQKTLDIVEKESLLFDIFKNLKKNGLKIIVGDEIGIEELSDCSIVYAPFNFFRGTDGFLATIGPKRMHYSSVIPAVRMMSHFIEEAITGWE